MSAPHAFRRAIGQPMIVAERLRVGNNRPFVRDLGTVTAVNKSRSNAAIRRVLILLLSAAMSMVGLVVNATPSLAATSSVTGIAGVIYDACRYHKFRYSIDPEKAVYDWSLEVRAFDPRGVEVTSAWLWKDEGDPSAGTASGSDNGLHICSWERAGTWRLEAELNFYDGPYSDEILASDTFTMRKARSKATLSVNDTTAQYSQRLRFSTRVTGEYPNGYFPLEYKTARLQKKTSAGWKKIARTSTNENGVARFSVVWKDRRRKAVRVVAVPGSPYSNAVSRTIRIY
jgi:hypothetical protein